MTRKTLTRRASRASARAPAMPRRVELSYRFGFDAAHHFPTQAKGHPYRSLHGHSFSVDITFHGSPQPPHGFVADFARIEKLCAALRRQLDHRLLNEIDGLALPSLENLTLWIWDRLIGKLPALTSVTVRRDSLGQSCSYRPTEQPIP